MSELLLLVSAGQGLLLSLALMSAWFKPDYFRFFLGLVFFVISIELWTYWGIATQHIQSNPAFPYWVLSSYLFIGPAVHWVLKIIRTPGAVPTKMDYLLFVPALVEITAKFIRYYVYYFWEVPLFPVDFFIWVFLTQQLPILWLILVLIRSFTYPASTRYYVAYILFSLFVLLWIVDYVFPNRIFTIVEAILVSSLFVFGYLAYLYPRFFDSAAPSAKLEKQFKKHNQKKDLAAFEKIIIENKGFTKPGLSLSEVATSLQLSPKYLSYLINKHYKTNFRSFINQLRVQEVITKVNAGEHRHMTLLGIALEAGFNSKSSFNAIFKAETGKSPSQYFQK